MKIALLSLFSVVFLAGAGCANLQRDTVQTREDGYSPDVSELVCDYGDRMIYAGESYNDGCNTHACQPDGTLISTERACERSE